MKRKSIKFQMLVPVLFLIMIAIALPTFITSGMLIRKSEKANEEQCIDDFHRSEERINTLLSDVYYSSINLWNDKDIVGYFIDDYEEGREETLHRVAFVRSVQKVIMPSSNTESVIFFTPNGKIAGYSRNSNYFDSSISPFKTFENDKELDHLIKWIGLLDSNSLQHINDKTSNNSYFVSGIKKQTYFLSDVSEKQSIYILFSVQKDALHNCFSYLEYDESDVLLLDNNGSVISGDSTVGYIPEFYNQISHNTSSFVFRDKNATQFHIIFYTMPTTGWTLVKKIPIDVYKSPLVSMWITAIIVGMATFLLVFVLYMMWVKNFTAPIRNLTYAITEIKSGNMDNRVELNQHYSAEMYLACEQFNSMLDSIKELLELTEKNEREHAALEIKTLQSQITPHFIYNTISSIRYMASLSGAKNIEDALLSFSNIIRPIFKTWQSEWTLSEELQLIENYINLMCIRFGSLFHIEENIDEKAKECRVPRFLIQTLLENSCEHGFRGESAINIKLNVKIENEFVYITVSDDGKGISKAELAKIKENIVSGNNTNNIGLANLDRRVKLYSGNDCGIFIESEYDEGTIITVKMRAF